MAETARLHFETPSAGQIPTRSGINWSHANAHVCASDAYIPIRQGDLLAHPSLFPMVEDGASVVDVIWDDGCRMRCTFEGTQVFNGKIYPKQISSYDDKSQLGEYLRKRLGVSGDHVVSMDDFDRYGRSHVDITRKDDGSFLFDFSVS